MTRPNERLRNTLAALAGTENYPLVNKRKAAAKATWLFRKAAKSTIMNDSRNAERLGRKKRESHKTSSAICGLT
jgi:hypothetical protein